jgi:uncharacterized membrane protein
MLAELLRLSKELYELEMVEESIDIDNMIHKLYGLSTNSCDQLGPEHNEGFDHTDSPDSLDSLRSEIQANATNETFKDELIDIIYESFNSSDLEYIRNLITDYIE